MSATSSQTTAWMAAYGWLSQEEGGALQDLARDRKVLELGALCGRSTLCLADVARLVVPADWFRGDRWAGFNDTLGDYLSNIRGRENVIPIIARHEHLGEFLGPEVFDLVFVDGSHDFVSAKRDTALALQLVVPGGVIAWHDYGDPGFPDVERAAAIFFPDQKLDGLVGSLGWRKLP